MMLTPEQRDELKAAAYGRGFVHDGLLRAVLAHLDAQQARISELEKDAARLDFIEKHHDMRLSTRSGKWWAFDKFSNYEQATHRTLREAIDAAMPQTWPEDTSDYGSRIAATCKNGGE